MSKAVGDKPQSSSGLKRAGDSELLQALMVALPDCHIFIKDRESRFLITNAFHLKSLGAESLDQVIGKTDFDFSPKHLAQQYFKDEQEVISSGKPLIDRDEPMTDAAGQEHWLLTTKTPFTDSDGKIVGIVGISRDITQRKLSEQQLAGHRDRLEEQVSERTARLTELNSQLRAEIQEKQKAQQELQVQHDRFQSLTDNLPGCYIFIKDRESRFVSSNRCHLTLVGGKRPEDIVGKTDFDFFPKEYATRYLNDEQELMKSSAPLMRSEEPCIDGEGNTIWLLTTKVPLRDADGKVTGLVGMSLDITELKRATDALKEERNFLRTMIDLLPFWIYVKDFKGRFILYNEMCARRGGFTEKDYLLGKTDFDIQPPEKAKLFFDEEQALMRAGEGSIHRSDPYTDGKGEEVYLEVHKVPLKDSQGRVTGLLGINTEVTELYKKELALRKSGQMLEEERNLLRTLIDNMPHAVYVKNTDGRFVIANKAVVEMMKAPSVEALLGKTDFDFYPEGLASEFQHDEQIIIATGKPLLNKIEPKKAEDGQTLWILTSKLPLYDRDGKVWGIAGIGIDDTKRKREEERRRHAEDQLKQAEKMKAIGHLAGGIAHDFNNQLAAIMGSADMIRTWPEDKAVGEHAEMIITASKRAADLTGKLLAFARKGRYQSLPVDVHKLIGEVVSLLERSISKRIRINQKLLASPCIVKGDPTQLQNALLNVAINARDAMPEEGEINFNTEIVTFDDLYCRHHPHEIRPGTYIKITVADTGVGMDEETRKHIFEPFFTTKKEGEGTGMGLAAVYGTVRNHQGSVTFSTNLGYGTKFNICLPLLEGKTETESPEVREGFVSGVANILVVDDEEVVRVTLKAILEKLGYKTVLCGDGEEAVEYYNKSWKNVDLVIVDMVMPRLGGLDTFLTMRKVNPQVRAILSSGYSIAGDAQRIVDEGVLSFIQKPFQVAALSRTVAEALKK